MDERLKALKEAALAASEGQFPFILPDFAGEEVDVTPNLPLSSVFRELEKGSLAKSWEIPSIVGSVYTADDEYLLLLQIFDDVDALQVQNSPIEPPIRKEGVLDYRIGQLLKYRCLHASFVSDRFTSEYGTAMYMDVYGKITKFGSQNADEIELRPILWAKDIGLPIEFEITEAYWSYIRNPKGYCFL